MLDSRFSYITSAAASNAFYSDSQFIGYGFATSLQGEELRVLQVYPDSPASEAGLARGDYILEVDGRSVAFLVAIRADWFGLWRQRDWDFVGDPVPVTGWRGTSAANDEAARDHSDGVADPRL